MYFWYIKGLIYQLQNNRTTLIDIIAYTTLLIITSLLGISVINLLPTLYLIFFSQVKTYLEQQAAPALLVINVYQTMHDAFLAVNLIIILAGIAFCFLVHKGTIKEFLMRTLALAWPICFRILVVSFIIFTLIMALFSLYYGYKLLLITKMPVPKGPLVLWPLKYLLKATKTYTTAKALWAQAHNLAKAQKVFDQINRVSFYTYWICQAGSIFSTMWWMLTLQEKVRVVNKK